MNQLLYSLSYLNDCHCMFVYSDFPEELSKLSLTEQPSPLYSEKKADLWQHINGTVLEEGDSDSNFCPYHSHLNLPPAANPSYLTVITGMHVGPLMTVQPYGSSQDEVPCCTLQHHNSNDAWTGCPSTWHYTPHGTVNAAGNGVADAVISRRASTSVSCRHSNTPVLTNKLQSVSHFRLSLLRYCTLCIKKHATFNLLQLGFASVDLDNCRYCA